MMPQYNDALPAYLIQHIRDYRHEMYGTFLPEEEEEVPRDTHTSFLRRENGLPSPFLKAYNASNSQEQNAVHHDGPGQGDPATGDQ